MDRNRNHLERATKPFAANSCKNLMDENEKTEDGKGKYHVRQDDEYN